MDKQPNPENRPTVGKRLRTAVGRMNPSLSIVTCAGVALAYLVGMYVTGPMHLPSRWMGAMLACTSVVIVLRSPGYRESLKIGLIRVLGTFLGATVAFLYLSFFRFTVVGMLASVFVLEMASMFLGLYKNDRISTITMLIILLISQMRPGTPPWQNCLLRFVESVAGVAIGVAMLGVLDWWNRRKKERAKQKKEVG